ncbi:MFS transporter [Aureimonas frigidaquae]|uniref:Possible major facilitator superfamily n=1 Tax=Aureimonas frigidaquae TaxID=424757 RepID=A0A0P0Z1E0_9HYPH|nr:MFS transporter [Aureimonas frigidaquae]BAT27821.1 possible major facilitator superfamily [Aureimonas frigidaquae]
MGRFIADNARWLAGGFLLTLFSSFGQTFFISLSNPGIREAYGLTHGAFGGLYMLATLGSALTLPFLGRVMDRYPTVSVAAGTILMLAAATVAMGLSTSLPFLVLSLYLLRLFGQGMMTQTALTATGRWFVANRGRAVSLVNLGQQAGEAAFPFLFVLVAGAIGWRQSWFTGTAVLLLVALPAVLILLRRDRVPLTRPVAHAQEAGRDWTLAQVLRDPNFYLISAGVLAPPFVATTIFFHQVYLTELRGWPLTLFAAGFAVMSVANVTFTLFAGWLIDRLSALRVLPLFLLPLAAASLIAAFVTAPFAIFFFMALMGVSNGFSSTLSGAMWPELYGTRHLGAIRSVVVATMVFASAAGPGLTGYLIDAGVDYDLQLAAMGAYALVAAAGMWAVSRRLRR